MQQTHSILTTELDLLSFSWRQGVAGGNWKLGFFLALCAIIGYFLLREKDLYYPARLLWGYALGLALYTLEFPAVIFGAETDAAFRTTAGQNAVEVMLIPGFALFAHEKTVGRIFGAMKWVALFEIACAVTGTRGLLIAPSFNLAFVALYLPFAPWWIWVLGTAAILTTHAGCAQLMLAVYALLWAYRNLRWQLLAPAVAAIIPLLFAVTYYHSKAPLLDSMERVNRWTGRFQYFWLFADPSGTTHKPAWDFIIFGVGPATFMWTSMLIDQFKDPMIIFQHNEWMQIPWELGLVGLALTLAVYQRALRNAANDRPLLDSLIALIPLAFFWHPLRYAPTALWVALLFRRAILKKKTAPFEAVSVVGLN